jgi:nitrogen fixation protein FixH
MDNEKKVLKSFVQFFGIIVNVDIHLIWKDWSFICGHEAKTTF